MDRYLLEDKNFLGNRMRELRLIFGFKQSDVAKSLNVSRSTYSYYETGTTRPDPSVLAKLSNYYDIPVEFFYTDYPVDSLVLRDSGSSFRRSSRLPAEGVDPERVGELFPLERSLILLLRSNGYVSTEQVLDELEIFIARKRREEKLAKNSGQGDTL